MFTHLERHAPEHNLARFYRIEVSPTLFGAWSMRRIWGRMGTRGQVRQATYAHRAEAEAAARALAAQKARRGYILCAAG